MFSVMKTRFPIRAKLSLMSVITITVTGVTLGIFLSSSFSNSTYDIALANLDGAATQASSSIQNTISSTDTSIRLLINQIGYNYDFANNIEDVSKTEEAAKKIKIALAGANGVGDGSTIIGAMDYLVVSDKNIDSATMYSPYVNEPILSRLYNTSDSKIECTTARYNALIEHPGKSFWFFKNTDELYVWKALVNYGVEDTYNMKVVGYIEYQINKNNFLSSLSDSKYENEGMMLFDENNQKVLSLSCGIESIDNTINENFATYKVGPARYSNYSISVRKITSQNWTYVAFINHQIIETTTRRSTILTAIIVAIAIVIGVSLSILLASGTIKRVKRLSRAATEISGGDYSTRIENKTNDEIGDVSESFNSMANQIQEVLNELVLQQDSISENFAIILSNKSGESGNHVKRVSEYSAILAEELGFNESEIHDIRIASMLHDVGKIMVDESILHKPGRFTDEEYKIMQQHVVYGGQLLKGVPGNIMQLGAIIAEYHHERYDGRGYVKGLKGEEIPKEAQITSVADVFDALVSKRCYKEPWTIEDAYNEIVAQSGKQFGPDVVEAFKKRFEDFKRIAEEYKE